MSVIEDVQKVTQNLGAPELKAITERRAASDAIATTRHDELLAKHVT